MPFIGYVVCYLLSYLHGLPQSLDHYLHRPTTHLWPVLPNFQDLPICNLRPQEERGR